ncbi:uncharacterized protein DUF4421 [Algoriphagus ratkowskyi]|uniref:DUF4421 domain-containing protein n=1 Tax=Algoriphagus ratkowskyi TaxID=57028 RepID=A0A2W7R2E6_9BACT|nr:DUF4421 domain-containing protein [Algoriphagus ratkowskyi]PZX50097.1 uncharacterized protein DUF4421 [Algoriphagus ratkowskyi]TXD75576.1 DUF4421 domain-containing protein [Algoriphagus ratkowskyi]
MVYAKKVYLIILGIVFLFSNVNAQDGDSNLDTSYIELTDHLFAARLFLTHKFTDLAVRVPNENRTYLFEPNSGLNLGLGFSYQTFTLNIAVPFGFMNQDRQDNWPAYLDLQVHAYPQKWIFDLYGQFYRGYTIDSKYLENSGEKYLREDIKMNSVGLNANYLFWGDKLSLAAAFSQTRIQKKSAISPFIGFEGYVGNAKADSLFLPTTENVANFNFDSSRYLQFGPNAGLAGTLVFWNGFFLTGVASVNYSVGFSEWSRDTVSFKKWGGVPTYLLRGFFGYNDRRFSVNVNYVYKNLNLMVNQPFDQSVNTGNYRLNFIYKFEVSKSFSRKFYKINPMRILSKNIDY